MFADFERGYEDLELRTRKLKDARFAINEAHTVTPNFTASRRLWLNYGAP
ncbi:hypothetical protein [Hyphomicrobium sp. 99]|nr:hypothetical protein [Hyphomicrobium sp. 99]